MHFQDVSCTLFCWLHSSILKHKLKTLFTAKTLAFVSCRVHYSKWNWTVHLLFSITILQLIFLLKTVMVFWCVNLTRPQSLVFRQTLTWGRNWQRGKGWGRWLDPGPDLWMGVTCCPPTDHHALPLQTPLVLQELGASVALCSIFAWPQTPDWSLTSSSPYWELFENGYPEPRSVPSDDVDWTCGGSESGRWTKGPGMALSPPFLPTIVWWGPKLTAVDYRVSSRWEHRDSK